MAERKTVDPKTLKTSDLIAMLNPEMCALMLFGNDFEHAPDSDKEWRAEVENAMHAAAAELDRRIPVPEGG